MKRKRKANRIEQEKWLCVWPRCHGFQDLQEIQIAQSKMDAKNAFIEQHPELIPQQILHLQIIPQ